MSLVYSNGLPSHQINLIQHTQNVVEQEICIMYMQQTNLQQPCDSIMSMSNFSCTLMNLQNQYSSEEEKGPTQCYQDVNQKVACDCKVKLCYQFILVCQRVEIHSHRHPGAVRVQQEPRTVRASAAAGLSAAPSCRTGGCAQTGTPQVPLGFEGE